MSEAIENHGIIGDLRTAALVALDGGIDFLCWPRFDSPSVFASLVGGQAGGCFHLAPTLDGARRRQLYLPDTNMLLTRFLSAGGVAELSDFMVLGENDPTQRLVRRAKAVRGPVRFIMRCAPRFDYGRAAHEASMQDGAILFRSKGADATTLRLRSTHVMHLQDADACAEFELGSGETACFVLEDPTSEPERTMVARDEVVHAFKQTSDTWRDWTGRSTYRGRWRDVVSRSALALKLLTSAEHGSIIAAATFGLPEQVGGGRNWDYRYSWLRDAAFTLYGFLRIGHTTEASAFMRWLSEREGDAAGDGRMQLMYGVDGREDLEETELPHFAGYQDSRPVRIGNAARQQLQLDIYGDLMDAIYLSDKYGEQISWQGWISVSRSMEWLRAHWQQPDAGIWEIRGEPRHFLHSRLMVWVAFDRAVRLARKRALPAPLGEWVAARDAVFHEIHTKFWDPDQQCFVQSKGGSAIDASCLLMPLVRFIAPTDPRWLSTLKKVSETLVVDSLVYRYSNADGNDGISGDEGTFTMCSFWYVECLARAGDLLQARFLFEKMLGYANHVGLFSEELGASGEHLGNFPQAFTHLALISAAYYLDRALSHKGMD